MFYRNRGKEHLPERVAHFAEKMGLAPEQVSVIELKNRWALCSVKRPNLNFHWKIMMAPLTVIDYLIVHELGCPVLERGGQGLAELCQAEGMVETVWGIVGDIILKW